MPKRALVFLLVLMLGTAFGTAQKPASAKAPPVSENKLIALKVTGSQRYTEKEILPASGLVLGQNVVEADFKETARRLGNTGLFTDVAYSFSFSPAGTKLDLELTDIDEKKLVPAHFENFVWFTDEQLLTEIRQRVPLFKLHVPVSGTMPDNIEQALQAMIDEKRIPARVDYLREAPQNGGELISVSYRIEALEIRIRNVEFPGATPDQLPALQAAARKLAGASFMRSALAQVASIEFMPVCLQRGYLKAAFGDAQGRVVTQREGEVEVDAIFPVTPGKVYSTSAVEWKGNSVFPSSDLQKLISLPVGQPADAVNLVSDLEKVTSVYHTKGYMAAHITPQATLDDEHSTVRYDLNVVEGDQFKMGELEITGLDSQSRTKLLAAWKLNEGDPYDSGYPRRFLNDLPRLLSNSVPWEVGYREAVNDRDKTVDVSIRFSTK